MERSSKEWDLIRLALEQAEVVLKKVQEAMHNPDQSYSINENTIESIQQAIEGISASLSDGYTLSQVAEDVEYDELVEELRSLNMPMTQDEYLIAQKFKGIG